MHGFFTGSASPLLVRTALFLLMCVWAGGAEATPVIAAYQDIYRMNFEVVNQAGLPAGWFITADGYPVAQVRPNHWVYGRTDYQGILVPTEVAVGAVVPANVPQLSRVAVPSWRSEAYDTKQFRSITLSGYNNMGVLDDPLAYAPVAWKSGKAELRVWLGDRWLRIVPRPDQSISQALMAWHPYIVSELRKSSIMWSMHDTWELADLAREWGYLWHGLISYTFLSGYRQGGSSSERTARVTNNLPDRDTDGREWDIGDGGSSSGDGKGSGLDSGGSGNTGSGGWDK